MPELNFYWSKSDCDLFITYLLSLGLKFFPDLDYSTPEYKPIEDAIELLKATRDTNLFLGISPLFSKLPLEYVRYDEGKKIGLYFIMQRHGGPTMDVMFSREIHGTNDVLITPGFISYYSKYWDWKKRIDVHAPSKQKELFQDIKKYICLKSEKFSGNTNSYWIGPGALVMQREGAKLGQISIKNK